MNIIDNFNMKLLQAFLTVAEKQSFRQAAIELNRSHSSISAQIMQLESQLKVKLFTRTTRKVELTEEGQYLRESAQRALYEVNHGLRRIRESVDLKQGQLSLACSSSLASSYLPKILVSFLKQYSEVAVTVRELTSELLFEALLKKDVDFALGPYTTDEAYDCKVVLVEPLSALIPAHLTVAGQHSISLKELVTMPLMLSTSSTAMRHILDVAMSSHGLTLSSRFQFIQAQTLIAMAEAGLGVAVLPTSSLLSAKSRSTRILPIVDPTIERSIAVIKLRNQELSPAAELLAEKIAQRLKTIGSR
ncbi:LysR family transcriptional regulator [Advenella kashmirensis]